MALKERLHWGCTISCQTGASVETSAGEQGSYYSATSVTMPFCSVTLTVKVLMPLVPVTMMPLCSVISGVMILLLVTMVLLCSVILTVAVMMILLPVTMVPVCSVRLTLRMMMIPLPITITANDVKR